jgi:hypothetical protein
MWYDSPARVAVALVFAGQLGAQKTPDLAPYLIADRNAEIALARSAAPGHVADSAAVLVLTRKGYTEAVPGRNGFVCFVQRSFFGRYGDPKFWDSSNRGPICLNPPAVRTVLPEMLKRTEWIMAGVAVKDIVERSRQAYASRTFPMPAPGSMGFMLSPAQHLADTDPHWVPHLMFFFDRSMPASTWGVGGNPTTVIDGTADDASNPVLTLFIPVRRWSDGKPALPAPGK